MQVLQREPFLQLAQRGRPPANCINMLSMPALTAGLYPAEWGCRTEWLMCLHVMPGAASAPNSMPTVREFPLPCRLRAEVTYCDALPRHAYMRAELEQRAADSEQKSPTVTHFQGMHI